MTLAACGATSAATSDLAARSQTRDAVLLDVAAAPVNGGINPDAFGLQVSGRVQLGSNPCMARGATASLVQARRGDVVEVKAVITSEVEREPRICTMEYRPVFAAVQTTVRGSWAQVKDVIVKNVGERGHDVSAFELSGRFDAVVKDVEHHAINGGINPDAFAVSITATVEKGANPCVAANNTVKFVQQQKGDTVYVRAVRRPIVAHRICTMEYNPQFVQIATEVRALRSEVTKVVLLNVDAIGNEQLVD